MENHGKRFEEQFCFKLKTCAGCRDLLMKRKSFEKNRIKSDVQVAGPRSSLWW